MSSITLPKGPNRHRGSLPPSDGEFHGGGIRHIPERGQTGPRHETVDPGRRTCESDKQPSL